jgi:hypothetical protein
VSEWVVVVVVGVKTGGVALLNNAGLLFSRGTTAELQQSSPRPGRYVLSEVGGGLVTLPINNLVHTAFRVLRAVQSNHPPSDLNVVIYTTDGNIFKAEPDHINLKYHLLYHGHQLAIPVSYD